MQPISTVRCARSEDLPSLRHLLGPHATPQLEAQLVPCVAGERYGLVLDEGGQVAAAALIFLRGAEVHIDFLAVAPHFRAAHVEARILAVVEAIGEAFGCSTLDVAHAA